MTKRSRVRRPAPKKRAKVKAKRTTVKARKRVVTKRRVSAKRVSPLCEVFLCAEPAVVANRCKAHRLTAAEHDLRKGLAEEARDIRRETHKTLRDALDIHSAMA